MPKIDIFLNSTAMSRLRCDRWYQVSCAWGYEGHAGPGAEFGSEFHNYAEYSAKAGETADFIKYFTELNPGLSKPLQKLCIYYQQMDPFKGSEIVSDSASTPGVEYKFAFPYAENEDYRIIICGTIDRIDYEDGTLRVVDHKTSRNTKTKDVLREYELHLQVPFYMWVLKNYLSHLFPDGVSTKLAANDFIGRYHGVFLSFDPVKFELGNLIRLTPDMEVAVKEMVAAAAARMIAIHKLGDKLAPPTGMPHEACKHCHLINLCVTRNNADIYRYLSSQTSKPYDPRLWR